MNTRIPAGSDFVIERLNVQYDNGDAISLNALSDIRLSISETKASSTPVLTISLEDDAGRFAIDDALKTISIQVLRNDYAFVAGKEYYYNVWLVDSGLRATHLTDRFFVAQSVAFGS